MRRNFATPDSSEAESAGSSPTFGTAARQAARELTGAAGQQTEAGLELARAVAQLRQAAGELAAATRELSIRPASLALPLQPRDARAQVGRAGVSCCEALRELAPPARRMPSRCPPRRLHRLATPPSVD